MPQPLSKSPEGLELLLKQLLSKSWVVLRVLMSSFYPLMFTLNGPGVLWIVPHYFHMLPPPIYTIFYRFPKSRVVCIA